MFLCWKKYRHWVCFKPLFFFCVALFPLFTAAQTATAEDTLVGINPSEEKINKQENKTEYFLRNDKYTQDTIQLRQLPGDAVKKMRQDDDFWYANADLVKKQQPESSASIPFFQREWFQVVLWLIIIGGFAAGIIGYLSGSNVGLFRRKDKIIAGYEEDELAIENIFAINYQKEIDKAEGQRNFRMAIRLMFLRLLKDMAQKNIIQYKQDKTNLDYLLQLHPTGYYDHFFRITRHYEYSWYGQFGVSEEAYKIIRSEIKQFDRKLQ
jgi:hypothetical protein